MKEEWFREYERLYDEREDTNSPETDDELAKRAMRILVDRMIDLADLEE